MIVRQIEMGQTVSGARKISICVRTDSVLIVTVIQLDRDRFNVIPRVNVNAKKESVEKNATVVSKITSISALTVASRVIVI